MINPEAKQRAEAIGSLMVEYFQAYLTNPNCVLSNVEDADIALQACRHFAKRSLILAEEEYQQELAIRGTKKIVPILVN